MYTNSLCDFVIICCSPLLGGDANCVCFRSIASHSMETWNSCWISCVNSPNCLNFALQWMHPGKWPNLINLQSTDYRRDSLSTDCRPPFIAYTQSVRCTCHTRPAANPKHSSYRLNRRLPSFQFYLQQFFKHDFPKTHVRTSRRSVYRSCLVCDTCIRELMVIDVPPQRRFPVDNLAEWNNGHPLGLRTVHTYVLVYDMGNLETFQVSWLGGRNAVQVLFWEICSFRTGLECVPSPGGVHIPVSGSV